MVVIKVFWGDERLNSETFTQVIQSITERFKSHNTVSQNHSVETQKNVAIEVPASSGSVAKEDVLVDKVDAKKVGGEVDKQVAESMILDEEVSPVSQNDETNNKAVPAVVLEPTLHKPATSQDIPGVIMELEPLEDGTDDDVTLSDGQSVTADDLPMPDNGLQSIKSLLDQDEVQTLLNKNALEGIGEKWLQTLPDDAWVVQILGSYDRGAVVEFLKKHKTTKLYMLLGEKDALPWYVLVEGHYASAQQAKQSSVTLKNKLRHAVWVRRVKALRAAL